MAYNKIDLPDSGDYIDEVREFLLGEGVLPEDIFAVSAATGKGVRDLVRRTRIVLDAMPVVVRPLTSCNICQAQYLCADWTRGSGMLSWRGFRAFDLFCHRGACALTLVR